MSRNRARVAPEQAGPAAVTARVLCLVVVLLVLGCDAQPTTDEQWRHQPGDELLGGKATVRDITVNAFGHPAPGLERDQRLLFFVGNSFFKKNWVQAPASTAARDGLGPLFNARSCGGCHFKDGRGRPPEEGEVGTGLLVRLGHPSGDGTWQDDPIYGDQLQDQALPGLRAEGRLGIQWSEEEVTFADGSTVRLRAPSFAVEQPAFGDPAPGLRLSPRLAPQLIGLGLLEAVPEQVVLESADPDDADGDGISGRPNRVWDVEAGEHVLGRFGWKANQPTVLQQVAGAFAGDIGITSDLFPDVICARGDDACAASPNGGEPEIDRDDLDKTVLYSATLAVPMQRDHEDPQVVRGRRLFFEVGCESCHRARLETGEHPTLPALSYQTIRPYTDLLLHDMGPDLADGRPDGEADGSEWRTPPLWGLGLLGTVSGPPALMHDGRARTVMEAILWHGGEGEASRDRVRELPLDDRLALVRFLESL